MTGTLPHNLRAAVTTLIGRRDELAQLATLTTTHRLVTIAGPGGSGKTRLAAELSHRLVHAPAEPMASADELRWLDLGPITDPSEVVHTTARSLGVRLEADGRDPVAALVAGIRNRRPVIVFDTCEHLLTPVADLAERILEGCPGASVLTTSREPLGIQGEAVWRVPALSPSDAANLFVERARLVAQDVELSPQDPLVAAICARLDGLPLAIEMASAWMRVFTATQILAGLDERFRLLTGGLRRGTPRHRTLEASMSWSHDLLEPAERYVFRRLGAFVGEFDLSAVESVCGQPPDTDEEPAEILARLVDKSLLVTDRNVDQARYRLLDTVREFAADQLAQAGEVAETRDQHLSWCLQGLRAVDEMLRHDQDAAMRRFDEIEANATAALDWALHPSDPGPAQGRQLAHLMVMPWVLRSQSHRGRPLLSRAIAARVEPDDGLQHLLASDAAMLGIVAGRFGLAPTPNDDPPGSTTERLAHARFALAHTYETFFSDLDNSEHEGVSASAQGREAGDPFVEDFALIMAGYSLTARDRHDEAQRLAAPAAARALARGDRFCAAFALGVRQYAAMQTGHLADAVRLGREMVGLIEPLGDYFGLGALTVNLAIAVCHHGDARSARRVIAPMVDVAESTTDIDVVALPVPMGHICLREGDWENAARWFNRGTTRLDSGRPDWTAARCIPGAIEALRRLGQLDEAAALAERGQELDITAPEYVANLAEQRAYLLPASDPLAGTLHGRALDIRIRAGMRTFLPDSLDAIAAHQASEHPTDAVRLFAASTTARNTMGYPRPLGGQHDHDALITDLRASLDSETFDDARQAGSNMSLDEACELAQRERRRPARPDTGWASLTPAELGVVSLVTQGLTNADIARQLVVSRATVKTHLYHVFTKLGITNRTELAAIAHAHLPSSSAEDNE